MLSSSKDQLNMKKNMLQHKLIKAVENEDLRYSKTYGLITNEILRFNEDY